ncbi:MAG: outer membrane PBP1 activator LpoA protein [Pseudohongiellaceae bacterium]|jgi:outer membrane PBP1 activator LpoA protein
MYYPFLSPTDGMEKSVKIRGLIQLLLACPLFIVGCGSNPVPPTGQQATQSLEVSVNELIAFADESEGVSAARSRIAAIELLLSGQQEKLAMQQFDELMANKAIAGALQLSAITLGARVALANRVPNTALMLLDNQLAEPGAALDNEFWLILSQTYLALGQPIAAFNSLATLLTEPQSRNDDLHDLVWQALIQFNSAELDTLATNASSYQSRGWIELARTVDQQRASIKAQLDAIEQWRRIWNSHPASRSLPSALSRLEQVWDSRPKMIALILPLQEPAGIAIQEGFLAAYFRESESNRDTPKINFYDSSFATNIYPIYDSAIADGADMVIGPLNKELVNQLQRLPRLPVPTLALNYSDNPNTFNPENLYQFGLAPEDEIRQAIQLAVGSGFSNAAIITPVGNDYLRLISLFENAWSDAGGTLVSRTTFDSTTDYADVIKRLMAIDSSERRAEQLESLLPRNRIEFTPRRRQDIDFIYLIANPRQGRQIKPTLAFYFAENLPVLAYPSIYDGSPNSDANKDLNGIVILDAPWLVGQDDGLKETVNANLRQAGGPLQRLRALGLDSYQLHTRLQQLAASEILAVNGVTGLLTLTPEREIVRELNVAQFKDGVLQQFEGFITQTD